MHGGITGCGAAIGLVGTMGVRFGLPVTGAIVTMAGGVHEMDMVWVVATEKMGVEGVETTVVGITVRAPQARMAFRAAGSCAERGSGGELTAGSFDAALLPLFLGVD